MAALGNKAILSKNLKFYIEKSGMDRRQLAETWGFSYSSLSEWLNGNKYPRIDKIEIMADYFGILKSDLIEEKMSEEKAKDNDIMADIIVRMRTDSSFLSVVETLVKNKDFYAAVESFKNLDPEKAKGVADMLKAFSK